MNTLFKTSPVNIHRVAGGCCREASHREEYVINGSEAECGNLFIRFILTVPSHINNWPCRGQTPSIKCQIPEQFYYL